MATLPAALRTPAPVARWLAGKSRTERRIVALIAAAVGVTVLWLAVWQPMRRDADAMRAAREVDAAALGAARKMTEEAAGLARATPPPSMPADAHAVLERVLAQQGLRGAVTQLEWQEGRARLVFAAIPYDALVALLEALQREGHLRAVDATLTARVEPGMVRAELALAR
ncbi:MAG TPA: type II secretion system protein GspM [Casimicrobiaceae bacterium]|nr:type II secretion system protein GspM [Casimicrobiaceae bacterium]